MMRTGCLETYRALVSVPEPAFCVGREDLSH